MKVAGRYALIEVLGRGGAGTVWRARDELLDRGVAIKQIEAPRYLPPGEREAAKRRVVREARAAARLNHPGSTIVFDVVDEGDTAYIVMELVTAPTLADLVERDGPLSPERAAAVGADVLDVLQAAHARGIVHRDVKPGNVMVPAAATAKLTDFGIASLVDSPRITTSGLVLGSPAFMAPEQAHGRDVGTAADLWGLGATLYFAVEGEAPFERDGAMATMYAVVDEPPRAMRRAGHLAPVIAALLAKDPAERPPADRVRRWLDQVSRGQPVPELEPGDRPSKHATQVLAPMTAATSPAAAPTADGGGGGVDAPPGSPPPRRTPQPSITLEPAASDGGGRGAPPGAAARQSWSRRIGAAAAVALVLGAVAWALAQGIEQPTATAPAPTPVTGAAPTVDRVTTEPSPASQTPPTVSPTSTPAGAGGATAPEAAPTTAAITGAPSTEEPAVVPEGWQVFSDDSAPYTVAYPAGWEIEPLSGNRIDFRDPETGAYLRVDWTDEPADDPYEDWQRYEAEFSQRPDYERIALEPADFRGHPAAYWEYTYSDGGAALHAINLNVLTGDYAYALNFQTRAGDWDELGGMFEQFRRSFQPAA